ncbi:hypothetical protein P7C70_g4585, partial [Phenoliferia sp. Uapishka_3]
MSQQQHYPFVPQGYPPHFDPTLQSYDPRGHPHQHQQQHHLSPPPFYYQQPQNFTPYYPQQPSPYREDNTGGGGESTGTRLYGSDGSPTPSHSPSFHSSPYSPYTPYEPLYQPQHPPHNQWPQPPYSSSTNAPFSPTDSYPSNASSPRSRWSSAGSYQTYVPALVPGYPSPGPYQPYQQVHHQAPASSLKDLLKAPAPPQSYEPSNEIELTRGNLARVNLYGSDGRGGRRRGNAEGGSQPRSTMPKPPAHSPHALWVGNVPTDASHVELWRFFALRPVPASSPPYASKKDEYPDIDLESTGVESIHLIGRSNCDFFPPLRNIIPSLTHDLSPGPFVNYATDLHLQHSIAVSHNVSLRPFDPRCKELVCRVRKQGEDSKSGVGAQRTGGMHVLWATKTALKEENEASGGGAGGKTTKSVTGAEENKTAEGMRRGSEASSGGKSNSTSSTTSSFLTRYFPKRFFVLKAHDEADLRLSVERGIWATQSHNEPVLDQAFRACTEGVLLVFSANKSGEWFG